MKPFNPKIKFAILIHGREAQKRIATGRLAHLTLENSVLIPGYDYSRCPRVNALLEDPAFHPVVLYPGSGSTNLSNSGTPYEIPAGKQLLVFVIDGTWITARKTMQRSANLKALPQICFTPERPSRFRVRKQPQENFFSTVEAIHQTIELLGPSVDFNIGARTHDNLLHTFDQMIDQQIGLSADRKSYCYWKPGKRVTSSSAFPPSQL